MIKAYRIVTTYWRDIAHRQGATICSQLFQRLLLGSFWRWPVSDEFMKFVISFLHVNISIIQQCYPCLNVKLTCVHKFTHMLFTYMNMGLVTIYNSICMYTIYAVTEDQIFTQSQHDIICRKSGQKSVCCIRHVICMYLMHIFHKPGYRDPVIYQAGVHQLLSACSSLLRWRHPKSELISQQFSRRWIFIT